MAKAFNWDRDRVRKNIRRSGTEDRNHRPYLVQRRSKLPPVPPIPEGRDAGGYVDLGAPPARRAG